MKATLYFDGGCYQKDNTGSWAYIIKDDGRIIASDRGIFSNATSNSAEFFALLKGLEKARELGITHLLIMGDSELVVKTVNDEYKLSALHLRPFLWKIKQLLRDFSYVVIKWVPRKANRAGGLAHATMRAYTENRVAVKISDDDVKKIEEEYREYHQRIEERQRKLF